MFEQHAGEQGTESPVGTIRRDYRGFEAVLSRDIAHTREAVWAMLVDSDKIVQWLAPGDVELRPGGAVRIDFPESGASIDSHVLALDPPGLLSYSWSGPGEPERPLRWTLTAHGDGSRLVLTLQLPADEDAAKSAAGWDAHLEMLLAAIEGVPMRFPVDHFLARRQAYRDQLEALATPETDDGS